MTIIKITSGKTLVEYLKKLDVSEVFEINNANDEPSKKVVYSFITFIKDSDEIFFKNEKTGMFRQLTIESFINMIDINYFNGMVEVFKSLQVEKFI